MKDIHFQLLREYLDEIIVNNGVIKIEDPERIVEKVRVDFLVKLAFQFYRKLYNDGVITLNRGKWQWFRCSNCDEPCDEYNNLVSQQKKTPFLSQCPREKNVSASLKCLNCGEHYTSDKPRLSGESDQYMPLCKKCAEEIGEEIEIWERLFGSH